MSFYSDQKFGVIQRRWFGRPLTKGGEAAAAVAIIASGTTKTVMTKFYPKGPIKIEKVGCQVVATLASADNATGSVKRQRIQVKFYKGTNSTPRTTLIGSCHAICGAGGRTALMGIASQMGANLASPEVEAGKCLTIYLASANSDKGTVMTAIGTVAGGGTLAYFIDFRSHFDTTAKWEAT